jgi:hypothetical protein
MGTQTTLFVYCILLPQNPQQFFLVANAFIFSEIILSLPTILKKGKYDGTTSIVKEENQTRCN